MLTVLQLPVPPETLSTDSPSNDHNNIEQYQCKVLSLGNGGESEKKSCLHFLLQMISPTISLSTVEELGITLF
jgi:hypothetical protein